MVELLPQAFEFVRESANNRSIAQNAQVLVVYPTCRTRSRSKLAFQEGRACHDRSIRRSDAPQVCDPRQDCAVWKLQLDVCGKSGKQRELVHSARCFYCWRFRERIQRLVEEVQP